MKVTVGAIRQIVREEAERLNENEEAKAEAEAMTDMDMLAWAKTDLMQLLKPLANRWNDELKASIVDYIGLLGEKPAAAKVIMAKADTAAANLGESIARDELRNLIMAEATELVQD